jgi:hypothetical protein
MRSALAAILGLGLVANGLLMLALPGAWYDLVPGVPATGPLNPHFVRDIGAGYLVSGGALLAFALDPRIRMAALAGAAFLALHALVHLADAAFGRESFADLISDLPAVFVPPALALWIAWPRRGVAQKEGSYA